MSTRSSWPRTWWTDHWPSNRSIGSLWFYCWKASTGISLLALGSLDTSILSLFNSNLEFWFGNRDQLSELAFLGAIPLSKHGCRRRLSCTLWCCRFVYSLLFFNIPFASAGSFLGCFNNGNWLDCLKAALERRLVAQFLSMERKEKAALSFNRGEWINQPTPSSFALGLGLSLLAPKTSLNHNPDFQVSLWSKLATQPWAAHHARCTTYRCRTN